MVPPNPPLSRWLVALVFRAGDDLYRLYRAGGGPVPPARTIKRSEAYFKFLAPARGHSQSSRSARCHIERTTIQAIPSPPHRDIATIPTLRSLTMAHRHRAEAGWI